MEEKSEGSSFKKYIPYIAFFCLILIIFLAVYVRTSNIDNLRDIATGDYTLGPDLDPFLYLRHAQEIVNGNLQNPDIMRQAPLGVNNYAYSSLMPWFIVGLYNFLSIFTTTSVEYAAIILPVILFAITLLFFFLFMQKIFSFIMKKEYSYAVAIIATLLYSVIPEMLHRTTAGIPEIESLGMVWFWMAFYFFMMAWQSEKTKKSIIFGLLAGIATSLMMFSWGGYKYIFMVISLATLISFLFQKISKKNILVFTAWWIVPIITILIRDRGIGLITSSIPDFLFSSVVVFILFADILLYKFIIKEKHNKIKIPRPFFSLIVSVITLILLAGIFFGPTFIIDKFSSLTEGVLRPFGESRVGLTVAENRAPYYIELYNSFSVNLLGITISLFWLFFIGAFLLFYEAVRKFKGKDKIILLSSFALFLIMSIFSRYSPQSIFNGDNVLSQGIYISGFLILFIGLIYVFIKGKEETKENFMKINYSYLVLIAFMFFAIISMRGAIRLFFIIAPMMVISASFLPVKFFEYGFKTEDSFKKILYLGIVLIFAIMLTAITVNYARASYYETAYTIPGSYQQQWQYAMSWVRENTPENSIFVHWWDYGYWVQTIGLRATVTDGGHANSFWDHTTARYLMTAENEKTSIQLCKAHNVSYFLIDPTDIGKYGAYSSIASDSTGKDRASWIPTFSLDEKQTQELKNETVYVYTGGFYLDKDFIWDNKLLPQNAAVVPGFLVHVENNQIQSIESVIIYNNQRYYIPINYMYLNNEKIKLSDNGIDAILYFIPKLTSDGKINPIGASLFLSEKVSNSQLAKTYLLDETEMVLVHQEDSSIIKQIKNFYNITNMDFILLSSGDFQGPIKIFKVNYDESIPYYTEYLQGPALNKEDFAKLDYLGK